MLASGAGGHFGPTAARVNLRVEAPQPERARRGDKPGNNETVRNPGELSIPGVDVFK